MRNIVFLMRNNVSFIAGESKLTKKKMFSEEQKEKMVRELMEIVRKCRKLRDSPDYHVVSDMLEKILKSDKEEENKPDPYPVDWTLLEALLSKFREEEEEEACSHGLRVDEAKLDESKQMDFANVKLRLPCRISNGEDDPPPPVVPLFLPISRPTSPLQWRWKLNPNCPTSSLQWKRNSKYPVPSIKSRKVACENCGAMTHGSNSCLESSPKRGAKSTCKPFVLPDTEMMKRSPKMVSIKVREDLALKLLNNDAETQSMPKDPL